MGQNTGFEIKIKDLNLNFKLNQVIILSRYCRNMVRFMEALLQC
jgi:hypothetical protein